MKYELNRSRSWVAQSHPALTLEIDDVSLLAILVLQWYYMSTRPKLQIDASAAVRERAKAVAYDRGLSLTEFVLMALSKEGDKKLASLIDKDLGDRTKPGRPTLSPTKKK
jgi:hypothetical protein